MSAQRVNYLLLDNGNLVSELGRVTLDGKRGFIVLGQSPVPSRLRPIVACGTFDGEALQFDKGSMSAEQQNAVTRWWALKRSS